MHLDRGYWALAAGAVIAGALAPQMHAQYQLRQRPEMITSDDARRVPVPPHDPSKDPILVIRGATLIDGSGGSPLPNAVIVIRGNKIVDVGPANQVRIPAQVERTIDAKGLYMVPGLVDLHMHFRQQRGDDFAMFRDSDAAAAIRGIEKLGLYLDGGITAVRDLGGANDVAQKIQEAVARHIFPGPRVFWAGRLISSRGGHGDEITETASGHPKPLETSASQRVATGPWDWRLAVREEIRRGVDVIKLTAPYDKEEVAAAVDEAHMLGLPVTVDAFGDYVTWASQAGIDTIEHPLSISADTIKVMAEKKTALVPTLTAFYNPLTYGYPSAGIPPGGFFFTMSRRFSMTHEGNIETVRRARAAGIKIGVGTDIPFENERRYPGDHCVELKFLRDAGLSNKEILEAATRVGGEILAIPDKLGTLQKGKLADVLVVAGDPLQDIENLHKMRLVVADGRVVRDRIDNAPVPSEASKMK
jgi:imidazolonepropionase-like amidohydrolase